MSEPTAHLEWLPPITSHPLLNTHHEPKPIDPFTRSQLELAQTFLLTTLQTAPLPSADLLKQARAIGISQRTLNRARMLLKVSCYFDPESKRWLSNLPGQ